MDNKKPNKKQGAHLIYGNNDAILIWSENDRLLKITKKIGNELKLKTHILKYEQDIYAVHYFFLILDSLKVRNDILQNLNEMYEWEHRRGLSILLTNSIKIKVPVPLRKFVIKAPERITHDWLKLTVLNKYHLLKQHIGNKKSYDKVVLRMMYMMRLLRKPNNVIYIDELCNEFNVSSKTIKRDIDLLRSVGEAIIYDKKLQGYKLMHSIQAIDMDIKEGK